MSLLATRRVARARQVAARVTDPELPMLTLVDLGVLRDVDLVGDSHVVVCLSTCCLIGLWRPFAGAVILRCRLAWLVCTEDAAPIAQHAPACQRWMRATRR